MKIRTPSDASASSSSRSIVSCVSSRSNKSWIAPSRFRAAVTSARRLAPGRARSTTATATFEIRSTSRCRRLPRLGVARSDRAAYDPRRHLGRDRSGAVSASAPPGQPRVEIVRRPAVKRRRWQARRRFDHPVLDLTVRAHQDHQCAALNPAPRTRCAARHRRISAPAPARPRPTSPASMQCSFPRGYPRGCGLAPPACRADRLAALHRSRSPNCNSPSTNNRKPLLGRQPSGAGMRRKQESRVRQVRHDVADRRRGQRDRQTARECAAADRLAGLDVLLDNLAQHGGCSADRASAAGRRS